MSALVEIMLQLTLITLVVTSVLWYFISLFTC